MVMGRWLGVLIVGCGFAVACSNVGPLDDGFGGSGGVSIIVPSGSAGARNGRLMRPGGSGGAIGAGATGGFLGSVGANELSCMKSLFEACPTDRGTCGFDEGVQGLGGRPATGGSWGSGGTIGNTECFDSGVKVVWTTQSALCPGVSLSSWDSAAWDTEYAVYKADGSVCYVISYYRDCGDAAAVYAVRDGAGALVGTGSTGIRPGSDVTPSFTCANGDSCQGGDFCSPQVLSIPCSGSCR
jgi:hypothetical protein